MQSIAIKRFGHKLIIPEQRLSYIREGQAAGVVVIEHSHAFMNTHELLEEQPYAVVYSGLQVLDKDLEASGGVDRLMRISNWHVGTTPLEPISTPSPIHTTRPYHLSRTRMAKRSMTKGSL